MPTKLSDFVSKLYNAIVDMQTYELCCDMIDVVIDFLDIYGLSREARMIREQTAFDNQSSSLIKLNNNTVLYLKEVNKFLALVCILREENFNRQGIIDYNFLIFREGISQVFELHAKKMAEEDNYPLSSSVITTISNQYS
jgi:Ras-related GTP-binding protein C/D